MPVRVNSADLSRMSETDRARAFGLASPDTRIVYLKQVEAKLRDFEERYEMPSSELPKALETGQVRETGEVSQWRFWTYVRSQLAGKKE
jgi:hypothetical protein